MKFSDISYREYIALEIFHCFIDDDGASAAVCAQAAFRYADAFLECAGKQDKRVEHAEQRAQEAETKFEVLQSIHVNMGEDFAARVALTEVWKALGVDNQTEAMQKLRAKEVQS